MRAILWVSLLMLVTDPAFAHARLMHSEPADGSVLAASRGAVTLHFSQALQTRFSDFVLHYIGDEPDGRISDQTRLPRTAPVFDAARQQVDVPLPDNAATGWYVLDWGVLSVDGHGTTGTLRFVVSQ